MTTGGDSKTMRRTSLSFNRHYESSAPVKPPRRKSAEKEILGSSSGGSMSSPAKAAGQPVVQILDLETESPSTASVGGSGGVDDDDGGKEGVTRPQITRQIR